MVTEINYKLALDEYDAFFIHQTQCGNYVLIAEQRTKFEIGNKPDAIIRHYIALSDGKEELMICADLRSISIKKCHCSR